MNKDVIYIDVEDDITAIIGKIKDSKEKIVALVPPKHVGVLQSAVNLRLLDRMAKADKKNLVVVTNNQALVALAASARIPVAKNLQSKPEIADIPALAVDDGDDIIDGSELPVGEHARSTESREAAATAVAASPILKRRPSRDDAVESLEIEEQPTEPIVAAAAAATASRAAKKTKSGPKIPNFNTFRKRLLIGIGAGVLLIAGLVWAFVFAPAATVTITADTTPTQVGGTVKLGGTAATDAKAGIISSESQQLKKDSTVPFTATGKKDNGKQAVGTIKFSTSDADTALNGVTIPAGTVLTGSNGLNYTTNSTVSIGPTNYKNAPTDITAAASGASYNGLSGSMSGAPNKVSATITTSPSGGTSEIVTVVSNQDIQTALAQITGQSNDAIKKQLESQFKNGEIIIDSSFTADQGTPVSSPASGQQVGSDGKASLTVPMTYTVYAIPKTALDTYLTANLTSQLNNNKNQRIYDNGASKVGVGNFTKAEDGTLTVTVTTTGQIGPQIDENAVKKSIKGMVTGSVQSTLSQIDGVQNVSVRYSYFWVNKIPNNINKITIEFKVKNG